MDIGCSVVSWHWAIARTGGTIWSIYSLSSKNSGDHKRPHSPQGSAFWKGAQSPKSTQIMPPEAQHIQTLFSAPRLQREAFFSPFPLNIAKNCIMHQIHENLSSCCRKHQWYSKRDLKNKTVVAYRMLRNSHWPFLVWYFLYWHHFLNWLGFLLVFFFFSFIFHCILHLQF